MSLLSIDEFRQELKKREDKGVTKEDRRYINESPEAKQTGVKLVTRATDNLKTIIILTLIVFCVSLLALIFMAYTGKLNFVDVQLPIIPACPAPVACPAIPDIPACPSCPACTAQCNFPSELKVNLYNKTG